MPTSRERRTARAHRARQSLDAEWMVRLARTLAGLDAPPSPAPTGPEVIWVLRADGELAPTDPQGALAVSPLPGDDPVRALYGKLAPPEVDAVGFVGASHARHVGGAPARVEGTFVHLLRRDGVAVSVVPADGGREARVLGPDDEPGIGRIPDACRRMLGLATAPPPAHTIDHWLDQWLHLVVLLSLRHDRLTWRDLNDEVTAGFLRFPGAPSDLRRACTPAQVARVFVALGLTITWAELRDVDLARFADAAAAVGPPARLGRPGGSPDRHADPLQDRALVAWMDVGMYAREWSGGQLPSRVVFEVLEARLPPSVFDQVTAAVSLTFAQLPGRDAA